MVTPDDPNVIDLSKVREKIRRLLALAGNNPNEFEAASAAAKAAELMARYNVAADEARDGSFDRATIVGEGEVRFEEKHDGMVRLASAVARAFYCDLILHAGGRPGMGFGFIGREMNRQAAMETFEWLANVAFVIEALEYEARVANCRVDKRQTSLFDEPVGLQKPRSRPAHKHDFLMGFSNVMGDRLRLWRQELAKYNAGTAILVRTDEENRLYKKEHYRFLSSYATGGIKSRDTFGRGQAAGMLTELNRGAKVEGLRLGSGRS